MSKGFSAGGVGDFVWDAVEGLVAAGFFEVEASEVFWEAPGVILKSFVFAVEALGFTLESLGFTLDSPEDG